jgi:hypothetical protein
VTVPAMPWFWALATVGTSSRTAMNVITTTLYLFLTNHPLLKRPERHTNPGEEGK